MIVIAFNESWKDNLLVPVKDHHFFCFATPSAMVRSLYANAHRSYGSLSDSVEQNDITSLTRNQPVKFGRTKDGILSVIWKLYTKGIWG